MTLDAATPQTSRYVRSTSAEISKAVVALMREHTGRGPASVQTTIDVNAIVVTLRDTLTKADRTLAEHGQAQQVRDIRLALQNAMRDELVAVVEQLSGRTVEAFLSDNLADPDVTVEIFLLHAKDRDRSDAPSGAAALG